MATENNDSQFVRGLELLDSTIINAGSMIGSGIFIVSADITRQVGLPEWLIVVWPAPVIPIVYIVGATIILVVLFAY